MRLAWTRELNAHTKDPAMKARISDPAVGDLAKDEDQACQDH